MKKRILIVFLSVIGINSFAQKNNVNCNSNCKPNLHTCGLPKNSSDAKNLQKKWDETIIKLKTELSAISTSNKKFEIRNDTLQLATKINVDKKTQYNTSKFPLKKLVAITTSFNELVIYTKRKDIVVELYQYKKLQTSQITVLKKIKNKEHKKMITLFKQLKTMNRFRKKI